MSINDKVSVKFPTLKDVTIEGAISDIGSKAESGNAFPLKVELVERPPEIRSGMTAQVIFNFGQDNDTSVYLIPVSALDLRIPASGEKGTRGKAPVFILKDGYLYKEFR